MSNKHTAVRSLLLGAFTGGRAATPLAALAFHHDDPALAGSWQQWAMFRSPIGRGVLVAAAIGELVGDKLPKTPARISPGGLVGRIGTGALVGLAIGTTGPKNRALESAILGGVGALLGSFAGYLARKAVGGVTGAPDAAVALAEDATVIAGSVRVLRS
ncbi:DUF4126 family protein [Curtobacterium sp. RRHDQ10]|uniref:DUF4126 family protein n=1 Tax=Curtobacterium phyllosphaerae TaxID=3413379 RepID=UPI003BF25995